MAWCCPNCGMQVPGTPEQNDCWRCNPSSAPAGYVSKNRASQCSSTPTCGSRKAIIELDENGEMDEMDMIDAIANGTYKGDWDDIPGFK